MTTITVAVTAAVLFAGLLHAGWNAVAKSFTDQWVSFTLINIGVSVPCVALAPLLGLPISACWGYLAAAVVCHLAYELFLMSAYRDGALSRSYPIARGVAPVLVLAGGLVFAHEHVSGAELAGVALIVAGVMTLALFDRTAMSTRSVLFALATGVAIAVYTVIDGLGVRASHDALKYTVALFAIQGPIFLIMAYARPHPPMNQRPSRVALGVGAGVVSLVGYGVVLWAQTRAPLGVVSALRETGVVWAAAFGIVFFRERGGWRVIAAGCVVATGVMLIATA